MVEKVQLKNGMTVLKNLQTKSPVVSVQIWVNNGSANEPEDVAGVSHFIEHLLFKGTKSFGPGEIAQYIEGAGGQLNAYTSFDQTVYYMTLGSSKIDVGLKALSEMVFHPLFESLEIDREREVVIEEIRRGLDEPSRVNSQFAFKSFFKEHPYGKPIIGNDHIIEKITVEKIKEYFNEHYHPKHMFLLVTGDFDEKTIDKEIIKYFGVDVKFDPFKEKIQSLPDFSKKEFVTQKTNFEDSVFNFYWPSAPLNSKDYVCLEILALILGQGESSCLYKSLKLENPIVKTIGCYAYSLKQPGIFAINYKPMVGQEEAALVAFKNELANICKRGLTNEDFEKAITNFKSEVFYSMETCDGLARMVGQNYFYMKDENYNEKYLLLLEQITLSDIEDVFERFVLKVPVKLFVSTQQENNYVEKIQSIFETNFIEELKLKRNKNINEFNALLWKPKKQQDSSIKEFVLDHGARVYIKSQNETPVIQMDMAFLGGEKIDNSKGALALIAQKSWGRETKRLTESELVFKFDNLASSHSVFSGKHSLGMQVSTLSPFFEKMMELNFELLKETEVSQKIIDRDVHFITKHYENRKDNPLQVAFQEFMTQMFEGHYYENDSLKEVSLMKKMDSKNLSQFIDQHFDPANLVLSVVGDVDVDHTLRLIENGLSQLKLKKQPIKFGSYKGPQRDKSIEIESSKEQAQIIFGFQGLTYKDPRRPILSVVQSILSGQGGRLFLELRDKASLAYTVSPIRMEGQESGYFGSYIACAPSKKIKAIQMMKDEFEKLISNPVASSELNAAKASLIGRAEISLQRNSEISEKVLFDAIYGLQYDSYLNYAKAIESVTAEDIGKLMSELYSKPKILVSLG